ncbi:MAG: DUF4443 domain-containing protein [Candidatus Methanodesulfokora sp.]
MSLSELLALVKSRAPGPAPSFNILHAVRAILLLRNESMGRASLARKLGIGEGAVKNMIGRMKREGIVRTMRGGCLLTEKGRKIADEIAERIKAEAKLEGITLTVASKNYAILLKNSADKIKMGVEQRDIAVIFGASGATTLIFRNGKLLMPPDIDISVYNRRDSEIIMEKLRPEEGDVVVIGSASDELKAMYGALAAAISIIMPELFLG